ncbi:hypothetical protein VULLAG_LOCUS5197 [Vulpes lagopus]
MGRITSSSRSARTQCLIHSTEVVSISNLNQKLIWKLAGTHPWQLRTSAMREEPATFPSAQEQRLFGSEWRELSSEVRGRGV